MADIAELDLRDLRSVIVAADAGARDDDSRAVAEQLKAGLTERVESEQSAWLTEITELLAGGRAVRALRVSSRPPKAGSPLPAELAAKLTEATVASLTPETGQDRYATVLDALAFSPVRTQVTPVGIPAEPSPELISAVKKVAARLPQIASLFGIEASAPSKSRAGAKPRPPKPKLTDVPAPAAADAADASTEPAPAEATDEPLVEAVATPTAETSDLVESANETDAAVEEPASEGEETA
ncbi:unannotated protein [freshwater metagenome]|uniref:Unannotated protein n=1 Tax=freshwater metagenome TaxID=449393 RepID=A0A6J6AP00_9ZZZZ